MTLQRHSSPGRGVAIDVTPDNAGWDHVGFRLVRLAAGETYEASEAAREACLVTVTGRIAVAVTGERFNGLGGRDTVFTGAPAALYLSPDTPYAIEAETAAEIAICTAPAEGGKPVHLIAADRMTQETRGTGTNTRHVRNILHEGDAIAERLLVVEVVTPAGHWSSYPPHKHDRDAFPEETLLEETYYHRLSPPQGFAVQRVYTDDRSLDETMAVGDGDVVLVPRGYHPVGAAHGYDLYYLNVMAGPRRAWRFANHPDHAWILKN